MKNILYATIEKAEPQDDGTVKVYGYASSPSRDSDDEIVTPEAILNAIPDYMKFGAVREMHQPKAAGTALEMKVMEDGRTWFGAHVVDTEAVKKVQAKVYKGFSIGGKVLSRAEDDMNVITGIKLVEVSLVDRPANPDAVFTMYKAEDVDKDHDPTELSAIDQLSQLVNKGVIAPSRLVELAQEYINKGATTMADEPKQEDVKKSFWEVADLASLLGQLKCIQSSVAFEAAYEGDESDISNRLKQNITDLVGTLVAMIGEEAAEMAAEAGAEVVELADKPADVVKSDEPKAGDSEKGDDVEDDDDETKKPKDGEDEETPADDKDPEGKEKEKEDNEKSDGSNNDLNKALVGDDLLVKFADLVKSEVSSALDPIVQRIANLEAQPAPSKAVLKTVGKEADVVKADANVDEDVPPAGASPQEQAAFEIKKLHRAGGRV